MLTVVWLLLTRVLVRVPGHLKVDRSVVDAEYGELGAPGFEEKAVMAVFSLTALLWVFRTPLNLGSVVIPGWSQLLPHSGLMVRLPVNFGLFPDLVFREERGLEPDYWVPAADAVNRAVAAVRRGTIPTPRRTPAQWRTAEFVPEDPDHRAAERSRRRWILVGIFVAGGVGPVVGFVRWRKRRRATKR